MGSYRVCQLYTNFQGPMMNLSNEDDPRTLYPNAFAFLEYLEEADSSETGDVYFVGCGDVVKIGFTRNFPRRAEQLQTASAKKLKLYFTFSGSMADERMAHKIFASKRVNGEWFRIDHEMERFLSIMRELYKLLPRDVEERIIPL